LAGIHADHPPTVGIIHQAACRRPLGLGCFIASHAVVFGIEYSASHLLYGGMVSLSHVIFWIPALAALYRYRHETKASSGYQIWVGAILFFYSISLIFDLRDATIWVLHSVS